MDEVSSRTIEPTIAKLLIENRIIRSGAERCILKGAGNRLSSYSTAIGKILGVSKGTTNSGIDNFLVSSIPIGKVFDKKRDRILNINGENIDIFLEIVDA